MTTTPWIKLSATGLVAWFASGGSAGALPMLVVAGLLSLLALLDAAQGKVGEGARERIEERREKRAIGANDKALMMEASELLRRLLSRRVGPFYLALAGLAWLGFQVQPQDNASRGLAASRGWGSEAGNAHQATAAGLCACGKPLGHDKAATAKVSAEEAAKRVEALKKRTMNPAPKGIPTANFPGIGPNAKPLAPGLVPNAAAKLPPSAQKLLEASGQPSVPQANPPPSPSAIGPAEPRANLTPAPAPASSAPLSPTPQPSSSVPSKLPQPAGSPL